MATINQFQQYSQGENVITNNVLLMFSLLYEISPRYYEEYISGLIEDFNYYSVIPNFQQQRGNAGNGIIDGFIEMKSSKIIIETKVHGLEIINKLVKYTDSFSKDEIKLLFHLSSNKYDDNQIEIIRTTIKEKHPDFNINFHSLTYTQLVEQLNYLYTNYNYDSQLKRIAEHFEEYCRNSNLLEQKNILRAMACGQSFDLNKKHQFYFDLASRGYSKFNYLGIYFWKAVRFIGKIENVIVADYDNYSNTLKVHWSESNITIEQQNKLIAAIVDSENQGWSISQNHRFFLLKDFHETFFEKISSGGIFRVRYFDLRDYLGKKPSQNVEEIAEQLRTKNWS
jgi:hypothetical protein